MAFNFTPSQVEAWDYIRSAVEQGLNASQSLTQYREGGGAIRTQDWYRAYNAYSSYGETWDEVRYFGADDQYPERMWLEAPRQFANPYVAEVEFQRRISSTGELETTYRYIESDYRMSENEILDGLDELGQDYTEDEQWTVEYVKGYNLYKTG